MIKELIVSNLYWLFPVVYLLGSFVYYTVIYEIDENRSASDIVFEDVFVDFFIILFWLPFLGLTLIRLVLASKIGRAHV